MDKDERIELLEEAIRIQNRVVEGSMEAANYWRDQAMKMMDSKFREVRDADG